MDGIERIKAERERQIAKEGWTPEHDDSHTREEMAIAAACYAVKGTYAMCIERRIDCTNDAWPWSEEWDKRNKHSRLRQLEIAGALIAAEIDRIQRRDAKDNYEAFLQEKAAIQEEKDAAIPPGFPGSFDNPIGDDDPPSL